MFQNNNAAREIFYIFLWLIGIILFYTLVHTFLLEPSSNKSKHVKTKSIQSTYNTNKKETKPQHIQAVTHSVKTETKHIIKPVTLPTQNIKVAKPASIKTSTVVKTVNIPLHIEKPEPVLIEASVKHIEIKKIPEVEIPVIPVLKVPTVPIIPKIPIVSTPITVIKVPQVKKSIATNNQIVTVKKKSETHKMGEVIKEKATAKVKNIYDRNESIRLLETVRQDIIKKAEIAREDAIKGLKHP